MVLAFECAHGIKPPPYSAKSSILQAPKTTKRKAESRSYEETSPKQVDSDGEAFTDDEHPDFGGNKRSRGDHHPDKRTLDAGNNKEKEEELIEGEVCIA